jgi:hypothetical protein
MLSTAAAVWEDLQAKSGAGTMNNHNLILLYTFSPSPMIKQTMVISQFAQIFAKNNKVLQTILKSQNLHASNSSCSMGRPSS